MWLPATVRISGCNAGPGDTNIRTLGLFYRVLSLCVTNINPKTQGSAVITPFMTTTAKHNHKLINECIKLHLSSSSTYLWQEECLSQRLRGIRMTQLEKATYRLCMSLSTCRERTRLSSSRLDRHLEETTPIRCVYLQFPPTDSRWRRPPSLPPLAV